MQIFKTIITFIILIYPILCGIFASITWLIGDPIFGRPKLTKLISQLKVLLKNINRNVF